MNIAARSAAAGRFASDCQQRSGIPRARVEMFDDFAAAEPLWRRLELALPLATPYQRFEWLANWFSHIGRRNGAEPLIVAGLDRSDAPMFILPFMRERRLGCHIARFCGGSHSNLNMAIWRTDVAVKRPNRKSSGCWGMSPRPEASISSRCGANRRFGAACRTHLPRCPGNPLPTMFMSATLIPPRRSSSPDYPVGCARSSAD